jgi:peptidoglycan/xylan/chitin deacetylase (PgdA/CDA1 family)
LEISSGAPRAATGARAHTQRALKRAACVRDGLLPPDRGIVVLAYHRVGGQSEATEIDLPADLFSAQMELVAEKGVHTIDDALVALTSPIAPARDRVVVTFDDGTADFVDVALPILVRERIRSVLYIATDFIEEGRSFPDGGTPLSWSGIRDAVSTNLVTVGSHTHSHRLLDRVDARTATDELERSVELLFERAGVLAAHFAYPKAVPGTPATDALVRQLFSSAALAGTRPNRYGATDPWRLARSPVQRADGLEFFRHKVRGGMRFEDDVRRLANRVRYLGASA